LIEHLGGKPAPGRLRLIQAFVNTADFEGRREDFETPDRLSEWLVERELMPPGVPAGEDDLHNAREAREALRRMLLANNGASPDPAALETLDRLARDARLTLRFEPAGSAIIVPGAAGVDGALGALLAVAFEAMVDGSWERLKACPEDTCQFAFFDSSRNRSGTWCTMSVCGNRQKARQYRDRRRSRPG
jgi:predicted RNA-binding Zn ribbon-like protein